MLSLFFIGCGEEYLSENTLEKHQKSIKEKITNQNFNNNTQNILPIKTRKEIDDEELDALNLETKEPTEISKSTEELLDEERIDAEFNKKN